MATSLIFRKRVHGAVEFNDGEFAGVQTVGIEGEGPTTANHPGTPWRGDLFMRTVSGPTPCRIAKKVAVVNWDIGRLKGIVDVIVRRERCWTSAGASPRGTGSLHPVAIEAAA